MFNNFNDIDLHILNSFINMIIVNVANDYILKLQKETKNPPELIEKYLDESVNLIKKYRTIRFSDIKNNIVDVSIKEQKEFNELFKEDKEYEQLCKELNFTFLLMTNKKLQKKTLNIIYYNVDSYKKLIDQKLITKKQFYQTIIQKSKRKNISKLYTTYDNVGPILTQ